MDYFRSTSQAKSVTTVLPITVYGPQQPRMVSNNMHVFVTHNVWPLSSPDVNFLEDNSLNLDYYVLGDLRGPLISVPTTPWHLSDKIFRLQWKTFPGLASFLLAILLDVVKKLLL